MRRAAWHTPDPLAEACPAAGAADAVLDALSEALEPSSGPRSPFEVEQQRLAGRSNMYVVRRTMAGSADQRWMVKQPHVGWSQDDVDSPLSALGEFVALRRLHAHFEPLGVPFRVPAPVAYLPALDAFAMEYVPGVTVKGLLSYRSALRPAALLAGMSAAGAFLRHLHTLEDLPAAEVDLREEAQQVLAVADEKLSPLGLSLPDSVRRTMADFPALKVTSPQVRLHGDFGPANILLATDGTTVGLDAALSAVGHPEEDLVRFVALVSGALRLAPGLVAPPVARVRCELESRLLESYYQTRERPLLFEVKYIHQLARRWCRLRELAQQHEKRAVLPAKLMVIGAQVRRLMSETERRLTARLERG